MSEEQIVVRLNPDTPPTGSDLGIVNAARKSFGKRSEWDNEEDSHRLNFKPILKDKDKRLLEFLARGMTADDFDKFVEDRLSWNWLDDDAPSLDALRGALWEWRNTPTHDTPFNHGFFSFEIKAPIFVARHLVKHEYLIMSEYSRRYITDDVEFYQPEVWRKAAEDVKQGSSVEGVDSKLYVSDQVNVGNQQLLYNYKRMVLQGVAPEMARMVLPQSLMTAWTWSGTLGAFANMCKLRLGKDTQYETRLVAQRVYKHLKEQFPIAAPLLVEGVF